MKRIITISREFGASGGTIGHAVASRLGYEYYDKEIILRSAQESNLDIASIEKEPLLEGKLLMGVIAPKSQKNQGGQKDEK